MPPYSVTRLRARYSPVNTWVSEPRQRESSWRFLVYGDTRNSNGMHKLVADQMATEPAKFALHTGDLVGSGLRLEHWRLFLDESARLRQKMPFYPVIGNHERQAGYYLQLFSLPGLHGRYYAFSHQGLQFICLDSNILWGAQGRRQLAWVSQRLAAYPPGRSIVTLHHPPTSASSVLEHAGVTRALWPILQRAKVRLVFGGHYHLYERFDWQGIQVVTSGGGGAALRPYQQVKSFAQRFIKAFHYCRVTVRAARLTIEVVAVPSRVILDRLELQL